MLLFPPRVLSWDLSRGVEGNTGTAGDAETSGASGADRDEGQVVPVLPDSLSCPRLLSKWWDGKFLSFFKNLSHFDLAF